MVRKGLRSSANRKKISDDKISKKQNLNNGKPTLTSKNKNCDHLTHKKSYDIETVSTNLIFSSKSSEKRATRSQTKKNQLKERISSPKSHLSPKVNEIEPKPTRSQAKRFREMKIAVPKLQASPKISEKIETRTTRSNTKSVLLPLHKGEIAVEKNVVSNSKSVAIKREEFVKLPNYAVDSIVLAKQKYSITWPARILQIQKEKIRVYFFGDRREGFVSPFEIYSFKNSTAALKELIATKNKPRAYLIGVREVELLLQIPEERSLVKSL